MLTKIHENYDYKNKVGENQAVNFDEYKTICPECSGIHFSMNRESMKVCLQCGLVINETSYNSKNEPRNEEGYIVRSSIMGSSPKTYIGNIYERESNIKSKSLQTTQTHSFNHEELSIGRIQFEIVKLCSSLGISKNTAIKLNVIAQKLYIDLQKGYCSRSPINLAAATIYHGKKLYNYQVPLNKIVNASGQPRQRIMKTIKQTSEIFSKKYMSKNIFLMKEAKILILKYWTSKNLEQDKKPFILSNQFLRSESISLIRCNNAELIAGVCIGFTMISLNMGKIENIIYEIASNLRISSIKLLNSMLRTFRYRIKDATEINMITILPGYYKFMILNPLLIKDPRLIEIEKLIHSFMATLESSKLKDLTKRTYTSILKNALIYLKKYYRKFGDKHSNTIAVSVIAKSIIKHNLRDVCSVNFIAKVGSVGYESIKNCFKDMQD